MQKYNSILHRIEILPTVFIDRARFPAGKTRLVGVTDVRDRLPDVRIVVTYVMSNFLFCCLRSVKQFILYILSSLELIYKK
jgi:hypothetical protein